MKKIMTFLFILFLSTALFALDGVVTATEGKVEILKNDVWVIVKKGDLVPEGSTINTGFKASCTIKLGGSVIEIRKLSRVVLEQLEEQENTVVTKLYLDAGSLRNDVKPLKNKANDYKVQTAAVTSSVRGTQFEVWSNGNVSVYEGKVEVEDKAYHEIKMITAGENYIYRDRELPDLDPGQNGSHTNSDNATYMSTQYSPSSQINLE